MFTKKIAAFFVITLFAFISAASEIKAQVGNLKVESNLKSNDTKVKINKGDIIEVTSIGGKFQYNKTHEGFSYEGDTNTTKSDASFEFPDAVAHSLVMWVGDKKVKHYQVRKNIAIEATQDGNLYFGINDQSTRFADNIGAYDVTYKIIRKDTAKNKVCSPPTNKKVNISWMNKTDMPIRVNWIGFDCSEEKNTRLIKPGEVYDGESFVGHIFRVRGFEKNEDLGFIVVDSNNTNMNIYK